MLLCKEAVSRATEYGIYHFNSSRRFWQDKHCKYVARWSIIQVGTQFLQFHQL